MFRMQNSFFYQQLTIESYNDSDGVEVIVPGYYYYEKQIDRYTKNINIFDYNMVLIPINLRKNHWCMGALNFSAKRIE